MSSTGILAPLRNRDFRYLLAGFAMGQMLMPLQFITQILWVQAYAPEDIWLILVAAIAFSRGVGSLTFGLYGGALADRFDRRNLLVVMQLLLIVLTLAVGGLMLAGVQGWIGFSLFYALIFVAAGLQAIDAPTRLAIVPDVLRPEQIASGMAVNQAVGQIAMPIAMMSAGMIIYSFDFGGAYLVSALGHVLAVIFLLRMNYQPHERATDAPTGYGLGQTLRDVGQGLRYTRDHPVVLSVVALMVMMMALGFPATASLGPTWITKVVGVEIQYMGFVVMFWGAGSLVAALAMAQFASFPYRGALIGVGAVIFSLGFVVFVYDHTPMNAVIGNIGLGAGMTIAQVSSAVLIQHLVPNEVRGRVMSILQLNMGAAQLMTMPVALLGQWLTLPVLFPVMAFATLALVVLLLISRPQLLRSTIRPAVPVG